MLLVENYLEEKVVSFDTPVRETGNLCDLQSGKNFLRKIILSNCGNIAGYTCDGQPYRNLPT